MLMTGETKLPDDRPVEEEEVVSNTSELKSRLKEKYRLKDQEYAELVSARKELTELKAKVVELNTALGFNRGPTG